MAGATQALDRLTLANGHFEIENEATQRSVVYNDFAVTFDHSGSRAHATISATGPAGPWTIAAQASDGDAPTLSIQAHDLSLADLQTFDKRPPPLTAEGPIAIKLDAEAHARVGAARLHRPVHASAPDACGSTIPTRCRFSSTRRAAPWPGMRMRGGFASTGFRFLPD